MSVDTKIKLDGHVKLATILEWVKNNIDTNARIAYPFPSDNSVDNLDKCGINNYGPISKLEDPPKYVYDDSSDWKIQNVFLSFKYNGEPMTLFYFYSNINTFENLDYYKEYGLEYMVKAHTTLITMSSSNEAIEIGRRMCMYFGGWLDESDCDDEEYYRISKTTSVTEIASKLRKKPKT